MRKIWVLVGVIGLLCLGACGKTENEEVETTDPVSTDSGVEETQVPEEKETVEKEVEEEVVEIPIIYENDEDINTYLIRYNEANPDNPLAREDFEIYKHNGQEHENQIILDDAGIEVVISYYSSGKTEVTLEGEVADDDYKQAFIRYAKAYSSKLSNEDLGAYWKEAIDSDTSTTEFNEFEVFVQNFSNCIECVRITGEIE